MTTTQLSTPARHNLIRSADFTVDDSTRDGDGLTFSGYAALFDEPTVIDSWEGRFEEQIARGAFATSLAENTPVLQFDHGRHAVVGSLPLGVITDAHEDRVGVYVEARLHGNWLVEPVRDAIASGSIDGMSFRFEVVREQWHDPAGKLITDPNAIGEKIWRPSPDGLLRRTILELRCHELGPVVFPAYKGTSAAVRAADGTDPHVDILARAMLLTNPPASRSGAG